jgi:hypothetical protein
MQTRCKTGIEFEESFTKLGWKRLNSSPKLRWTGYGRTNIEKIVSLNFDHTNFCLLGGSYFDKYDLYNPRTFKDREVKKYYLSQISKWTLYSEPYFKVGSYQQVDLVDTVEYNNFVKNFYEYHTKSGLLEEVQRGMIRTAEGIQLIDGFVPKTQLEFRTVVLNGWAGYDRITIQFKIK